MARPPAAAPAPVRLRLVFENRRLLRRAERDEGLRRCWLLLRPELATVADLAAHVAARFRLRRSCPRGVSLSMDGFALPPFESTCIFRDKDIIRVKQKSCKKLVGHNDVLCIRDHEVVEKMPLPVDDKILAIQYHKDSSKYQEEEEHGDLQPEENATLSHSIENDCTNSKRKRHDGVAGIPEIKRKKLRAKNSGKNTDVSKEDCVHQDQDQNESKKLMSLSIDVGTKMATLQPETTITLVEQQNAERNNQTELECETKAADCNVQSDTKKSESRSARRKKIKRQIRLKAKLEKEKNQHENSSIAADCPSSSNQVDLPGPSSNQVDLPGPSSNQNGSHIPFSSHKADEEESDTSDEIVPVVVRPGHIRFEPAGGQPDKSPTKEAQGTFQWSGTLSKKKGQKWGLNGSNKKNADIGAGSSMEAKHRFIDNMVTENGYCAVSNQKDDESPNIETSSVKTIANEEKFNGESLDFESLYPLKRLPKKPRTAMLYREKPEYRGFSCRRCNSVSILTLAMKQLNFSPYIDQEGDLIAYRLLELSSSLCPELSSYRVGKVLIYDPISLRIILLPVPEYPIITEENKPEEESDMFVDLSPYKEDGSLEIEYSSLLDVRLLKGIESVPGAVSTPSAETCEEGGPLTGKRVTLDNNEGNIDCQKPSMVASNTKDQESTLRKTENAVWEKNSDPPNDKTDVQENGWGTWKRNASTSAWSYRALRSSALGPTMAMLRGKNSPRGKPPNRKYGK